MMILKTNRLNLILTILLGATAHAGTPKGSPFTCLKDILPLTDRGAYQSKRIDVETPFVRGNRFLVFPEVVKRKVTGFFVYDENSAWYYDTAVIGTAGKKIEVPIAGLDERKPAKIFQMVAQPAGLETVTIFYQPGFERDDTNKEGPVMLGSSVLPVVGAIVSRPESYDFVYRNPEPSAGRSPAGVPALPVEMVTLKTASPKSEKRLWQPLHEELRLRKAWIKEHNLDEVTFKDLSRALDSSCRE
jgi:hypothetical protein